MATSFALEVYTFFESIFGAKEVYSSDAKSFSLSKENFFLIGDLWIAIMEGKPIDRTYNHVAFRIEEKDLPKLKEKIEKLGLFILSSRSRSKEEGESLYFYDFDNHLFELHTGDLETRLQLYKAENK